MKMFASLVFSCLLFAGPLYAADPVCSEKSGFPCIEPVTGDRLIGGVAPDMKLWPNSLITRNCSITVVGERVAVHAAHCVSNGGSVSFAKGGNRYSAKCTHHPEYRGNSTADWALCYTDKVVDGGEYEVLHTNPELLQVGVQLTLSGYGCTKWGGGGFGTFRIGQAPIVSLPKGKNYDIVTKGNVALCSGDSGGASFLQLPGGQRYLVGVNSRSNTVTTSYMPGWHQSSVMIWGTRWAEEKGARICGYHMDAKGCRGNVPLPPPKKFEVKGKTILVQAELLPEAKYDVSFAKQKVDDLVLELDKQ